MKPGITRVTSEFSLKLFKHIINTLHDTLFKASDILGAQGPFEKQVEDFIPRQQQQEMADAVQAALKNTSSLVVEAGTGTGKTFAYLVPALLSGQKIIVSTGTKNLQDQLFHRDLPKVCKILNIPVKIA